MTRTCTVCRHDQFHDINVALVKRKPYRHIAERYSLSLAALKRHQDSHIPAILAEAALAAEVEATADLAAELAQEKTDIQRLKARAEEQDDVRTALIACDRALKALELQARVEQIIASAPTVNILTSRVWVETRSAIIGALEAYPDAREAVLRALEDDGNGLAG